MRKFIKALRTLLAFLLWLVLWLVLGCLAIVVAGFAVSAFWRLFLIGWGWAT